MTIYSGNGVSRILFQFIVSLSVVFMGVFKGGGVQPPPQKKLDFYLKSEGKEVERKGMGVRYKLLIYFLGLRNFRGGGGREIFGWGVENFFLGGGLRNFRGGG